MFFSENIMSTFSCHSCKYSFLFTFVIPFNTSVVIVPANQLSPGAGYGLPFCIFINSSTRVFISAFLSTKSFKAFKSVLDNPGIVIPCLVQTATLAACECVNPP